MYPKIDKSKICQIVNPIIIDGHQLVMVISDKTCYQWFVTLHIVTNRLSDDNFQCIKKAFAEIATTSFSIEIIKGDLVIVFHIR